MKKILITGSSGYVGQHLIAALAHHGINTYSTFKYEVYCAYNLLPTFESDLHKICTSGQHHPSIVKMEALSLDLTADVITKIQHICGSVDVVIHLAALSSPFYCQTHPSDAWAINVALKLVELNAPIVYMSTDQVYAGSKQFYQEDDETLPVNLYGRTKLAFERALLHGSTHDKTAPLLTKDELGDSTIPEYLNPANLQYLKPHPSSVILRSSLILGRATPFEHGCKKGSFPSFLQFVHDRLKSCTETEYFTNEYRSMVHIEDVVKAIMHFTEQSLNGGFDAVRTYNLGGSERVNRYELAVKMAEKLQLDGSCVKGVNRPQEEGSVPSPPDISMNVSKLTMELGAEKLDGLDEIIKITFGC